MSYAQENFSEAMYCVTSVGPLQSRLAAAAHYLIRPTADEDFPDHEQGDAWRRIMRDLTHIHTADEDFPDHEQGDAWRRIMRDLTHIQPEADEGSFAATTKRMDDGEALRVAREILHLYVSLVRQDAERAANRLGG